MESYLIKSLKVWEIVVINQNAFSPKQDWKNIDFVFKKNRINSNKDLEIFFFFYIETQLITLIALIAVAAIECNSLLQNAFIFSLH